MLCKYIKVKQHLLLCGFREVLEEICGERCGGNGVRAAFNHVNVAALHGGHAAAYHFQTLLVREHGDIFHHGNHNQVVHLFQGLLNQVLVTKGKGIGVHDYDACLVSTCKGAEAVTVLLQSPAVFKEDGLWSLSKHVEAKAFKDRPILRLGEHLEIAAAGYYTRNQRHHKALTAGLLCHCNAFYDVFADSRTGNDVAVCVLDCIVRVHGFHPEPVGPEEA